MPTGIEYRIFDNNRFLKTALAKALPAMGLTKGNAIFVNISYSENDNESSPYPGLRFVIKRRRAGDSCVAICYGFDDKKRLAKKENGSILKGEGVFYIQMPFDLSRQLRTIKKALSYGHPINEPLDPSTTKSEILRIVGLLKHNLPNVIGTIEPNINCLRNASTQKVHGEWSIVKETMLKAKRNRIEKEMVIFEALEKLLLSDQNRVYTEIRQELFKADTHYKDMFDILADSRGYSEMNRKSVIEKGQKIIEALNNARIMLERTINETSSC